MLDAKRALLLAISHELRSPLTRARLNTELLPETPEVTPQREALMRDLQEMASLINDLLESERLATQHVALNREPVDLAELARSVIDGLQSKHTQAANVRCMRRPIWIRCRSTARASACCCATCWTTPCATAPTPAQAPELHLRPAAGGGVEIEVRDFGPGVPEDQIGRMAEPFFRPDSARTRSAGGVGLGLYLCKLVAHAHGGTCAIRNAQPGLSVVVKLAGS